MKKAMKVRKTGGDRLFHIFCISVVVFLALIVLLPLMSVVANSFSSPQAVNSGKVLIWPVDFTLENYKAVFNYKVIWSGYRNTIFYTIVGTLINVSLTLICAYPLSVRTFSGRKVINKLLMITMIFSAGMIPNYILVRDLGLMNSIWAVLLPGAMSAYNVIITRTYIMTSIPSDLEEAAKIDGCDPFRYFLRFVLPLSKAIIAVIAMYYAVAHWNSYFSAFLYLSDREKYPLQLFLREVLISSKFDSSSIEDVELREQMSMLSATLKYVIIVVSTLPLMCLYPFVQKHFVKGVMIGSVKG